MTLFRAKGQIKDYNFSKVCFMKIHSIAAGLLLVVTSLVSSGCQRSTDEVWNDTKTAGRHVSRGVGTMGGKHGVSRQVSDPSQFGGSKGDNSTSQDFVAYADEKDSLRLEMSGEEVLPQPKETPGEPGSSIPGIENFKDPLQDPALAAIFEHVHFPYNSSLLKGDENVKILHGIADYMKQHPNLYVFIEGHCDKRGPAAYNFSLGANRANSVRALLIQDGINPDHLFTVSYGKEKLLFNEDSEEFQKLNRRGQFKVFEK